MPAPTPPEAIAAVPTTPDRNAGEDVFVPAMYTFLDYFAPLKAYLQNVVTYCADAIAFISPLASSAETNAGTAASAASTATTQAGIAVAAASSATLAPGTSATSTTSITPALGSTAFTLAETGKTFVVGQFVTVADSSSPADKYFNGAVTAFDSGTGAITVDARVAVGTSGSSWVVTGSAPAFGQRFTNPTQSFVALGSVSGTVNLNLNTALAFTCTLSGNTTFTFTMPDGYTSADAVAWSMRLTMGGSAYTIAYPAGTKFHEGANPVTAPSTTDEIVFQKYGSAAAELRRAARAIA